MFENRLIIITENLQQCSFSILAGIKKTEGGRRLARGGIITRISQYSVRLRLLLLCRRPTESEGSKRTQVTQRECTSKRTQDSRREKRGVEREGKRGRKDGGKQRLEKRNTRCASPCCSAQRRPRALSRPCGKLTVERPGGTNKMEQVLCVGH